MTKAKNSEPKSNQSAGTMSDAAEWEKVARNVASWLNGQDQKAAIRYINSVKERLNANKKS